MRLKNTIDTGLRVETTRDANQFKSLESNRVESLTHVKRIHKSMKTKLLYSPIYVNDELQVLDGQHRLAAIKILQDKSPDVVVDYIVLKGENYGSRDVPLYNTNSTNWKIVEHIESHLKRGNVKLAGIKDYIMGTFSRGAFMTLLTGKSSILPLTNGSVNYTDEELESAIEMRNALDDFKDAGVKQWKGLKFVKAFYKVYTSGLYKHVLMKPLLKELDMRIELPSVFENDESKTVADYEQDITNLYARGVFSK